MSRSKGWSIFAGIVALFLKASLSDQACSPALRIRALRMTSTAARVFPALRFDNRNLRSLPIDPVTTNSVREVSNAIFSRVAPTPVLNPRLVASSSALRLLEADQPFDLADEETLALYLGGNKLPEGAAPLAHCYCGYQFGNFAGQLGDGAAISLGEVVNGAGERWELQLKGAGPTPYSRSADGRKVLRSSVREFLCSEAMHHLGIPTTRAGSVVTSDSYTVRDPLYDGTAIEERCSIVSRIAPNFFRFGSLEIFLAADRTGSREGPSARNPKLKKQFLDYLITSFFPELDPVEGGIYTNESEEVKYQRLFDEVLKRTAELVALWQSFGWVHGVLNTDNMSIMGITIDYGPFAFMEQFDPEFTPNGSDGSARYAYRRQPAMCKFNLGKLAEAMHPLIPLQNLDKFDELYEAKYYGLMAQKLGLLESAQAPRMVSELFDCLSASGADFTDTFVALTEFVESMADAKEEGAVVASLRRKIISRCPTPQERIDAIKRAMRISRLSMGLMPQQLDMVWNLLQAKEPAVQQQVAEMFGGAPIDVVKEEVGNEKRKLDKIRDGSIAVKALEGTSPEAKADADGEIWSHWIESFASHVRSLSVEQRIEAAKRMRKVNPTFILRNWIAQEAISAAEENDFTKVRTVLKMLETPFDPRLSTFFGESGGSSIDSQGDSQIGEFVRRGPEWANRLICTCSS